MQVTTIRYVVVKLLSFMCKTLFTDRNITPVSNSPVAFPHVLTLFIMDFGNAKYTDVFSYLLIK